MAKETTFLIIALGMVVAYLLCWQRRMAIPDQQQAAVAVSSAPIDTLTPLWNANTRPFLFPPPLMAALPVAGVIP